MPLLTDLIPGLRWTFVGGKGGVGKTTTAAALAISLADRGSRVRVISVDPAHSLGDALEMKLGTEPVEVTGAPGLAAAELDAEREKDRYLQRNRGHILALIERGTYLDAEDARGFVDLALPGIDEIAALLALMRDADEPRDEGARALRTVIDTAPTGHTLRLLRMPGVAREWLAALRAMDAKHGAVASAFSGGAARDEASRFLDETATRLERLDAALRDPRQTRFVLVTTPQPEVLAETRRYIDELEDLGIAIGGVVVNHGHKAPDLAGGGPPVVLVPPLAAEPTGVDRLRRFASAAAQPEEGARDAASPGVRLAEPWAAPLDRRVYLVGGKGGVGKSTVAGALAVLLSDEVGDVLLLSTDPAGSLREVFGTGSLADAVAGAPRLTLDQIEAEREWAAFRDEYREQVRLIFAGLAARGVSAELDREVAERLVDLAPPGLDELVAIMEVVDAIEDGPYNAVVLDTAPTGHLLRLLETPQVALDWVRAVMRLLLKYREVVRVGEIGEKLVALSKSLKTLIGLLTDSARTWPLVVALPEALSVPETKRLLQRLDELDLSAGALLVNQLWRGEGEIPPRAQASAAELLESARPRQTAAAPDLEAGPVGADQLREFAACWRGIER